MGRIQFEDHVLSRERKLDIQLGDRGACPGPVSILKEIYSGAIQIPGRAITTERDRLVISDNHPNFRFNRTERQGFGSYKFVGRAIRHVAAAVQNLLAGQLTNLDLVFRDLTELFCIINAAISGR